MDDNCGEWVECMGVVSGCGEQEAGVVSGSGWNLWVWLVGVVVRRYIDFLILLIPTPLVSVLFLQQHPYFLFIFNPRRACAARVTVVVLCVFVSVCPLHFGHYE